MAAQNGRDLRVKKKIGAAFVTIAGAQEESLSIENGEIDITDKDDNGRVARLNGGNTDVSISISGVAKDEILQADAINNTEIEVQVEWVDTGTVWEGMAEIGSYESTGSADNAAIEFSCEIRPTSSDWTYTVGGGS